VSDSISVYLEKLRSAQNAKAELDNLLESLRSTTREVIDHWASYNWPGRPGIPANMPSSMAGFLAKNQLGLPVIPTSEQLARCTNVYLTALIAAHQALLTVPVEHRGNLQAPPD
jgi:hypothetical protein